MSKLQDGIRQNMKLIAPALALIALAAACAPVPAQAAPFNCGLPAFQRHGALQSACRAVSSAYDSTAAAQQNNNYNLGGHASNALTALQNAYNQLLAAAQAAR
jgi:hypothetical protein